MPADQIQYSEKYYDEIYEYSTDVPVQHRENTPPAPKKLYAKDNRARKFVLAPRTPRQKVDLHVILPPDITKLVPKSHLMTESEWRNLGIQQSPGWVHYMMHGPEPHVILFRRPRSDRPQETAPPIQQQTTVGKKSEQSKCLYQPS